MKCALLPASALVLVVTACGAGATSAPRVTEVGARVQSINLVAVRRKAAALQEAKLLLREFVPPPGARSARQPRGHGVLRQSGPPPIGEVVDVHGFWSQRKPLSSVAAFVRTHGPSGFRRSGATYGSNPPHYLMWTFSSRSRYLDLTAVALPGRTVLRVDAQVVWVYPRPSSEKVPPGTRAIVLTAPKVGRTVTDPTKVAKIVHWFDALPISPPGVVISCPLEVAPTIKLTFRGANGGDVARATLPSTAAWVCDPITFRIGGHTERPLVDGSANDSFVRRLQQLLGVRLIRVHR